MIVARTDKNGRTTAVRVYPGSTFIFGFLCALVGLILIGHGSLFGIPVGLFGGWSVWCSIVWLWRGASAL